MTSTSEMGKRSDEPAIKNDKSDIKKPKIHGTEEEENEEKGIYVGTNWSEPIYDSEEHGQVVQKYIEHFKISQGFDFIPYDGAGGFFGSFMPFDPEEDDILSRGCKRAVDYAIQKENDNRKSEHKKPLELVKLVKSNFGYSGMFYATFEAREIPDGAIQVYQAKVYHDIYLEDGVEDPDAEVFIFRLKPN